MKAGAVLRPVSGRSFAFQVSGKMTVEAGALIDVTGNGYLAGNSLNGSATPPEGSGRGDLAYWAGGSHGGQPVRSFQPGSDRRRSTTASTVPQMGGGGAAVRRSGYRWEPAAASIEIAAGRAGAGGRAAGARPATPTVNRDGVHRRRRLGAG